MAGVRLPVRILNMKYFHAAAALAAALIAWPATAQSTTKSTAKKAPKAAPAATKARPKTVGLEKAALEAYVRHLLLWNDQITVAVGDPKPAPMPGFQEVVVTGSAGGASLDETFYVSLDGTKIVRGTVYDVKKSPFERELALLKNESSPSMGTPGAPVVVVAFSDYQCSYCREEAKMIRANLLKTYPKEVIFYFRDFPLDPIHPWARNGSIAGLCVYRANPQAFWDFHDWIFDKQREITVENLKAKVMEWAQSKSLDTLQLGRCFDARATEAGINANVDEAKALRVNSTPTLFVNGRQVPGSLPWAQLKAVIDWELNYAAKAAKAEEECCSITLPTPVPAKK